MDLLRFVSDWLSFCYLFGLVTTVPYTLSVPAWIVYVRSSSREPIEPKVVFVSHQYVVQPGQQRKVENEMYIYALNSFPILLNHEPSGLMHGLLFIYYIIKM
jgi:hypothetical protein